MAGKTKTIFLEWEGVKLEDETENFYEAFKVIVGCDEEELLFTSCFFSNAGYAQNFFEKRKVYKFIFDGELEKTLFGIISGVQNGEFTIEDITDKTFLKKIWLEKEELEKKYEEEVRSLKAEITSYLRELSITEKKKSDKVSESKKLELKVNELKEELLYKQKENEEIKNQLEYKQTKINDLKHEVGHSQIETANFSKEITKLQKEKNELQQDIFSLQEKVHLDNKEIERISQKNEKLEEENQVLCEKIEELQIQEVNLGEKVKIRERKLQKIKADLEKKTNNIFLSSFLETLLISQEQLVRLQENNSQLTFLSKKQLNNAKQKLEAKLSKEELENICQLQIELTKLKIEIEQQEEEQQSQVEINE